MGLLFFQYALNSLKKTVIHKFLVAFLCKKVGSFAIIFISVYN